VIFGAMFDENSTAIQLYFADVADAKMFDKIRIPFKR
jgi:hypothetical protein